MFTKANEMVDSFVAFRAATANLSDDSLRALGEWVETYEPDSPMFFFLLRVSEARLYGENE